MIGIALNRNLVYWEKGIVRVVSSRVANDIKNISKCLNDKSMHILFSPVTASLMYWESLVIGRNAGKYCNQMNIPLFDLQFTSFSVC